VPSNELPYLGLVPAMTTYGQGAMEGAEKAYRALGAVSPVARPAWETLDQSAQETFALIWFAGFLTGRAKPESLG
jgi:hypothetical protein